MKLDRDMRRLRRRVRRRRNQQMGRRRVRHRPASTLPLPGAATMTQRRIERAMCTERLVGARRTPPHRRPRWRRPRPAPRQSPDAPAAAARIAIRRRGRSRGRQQSRRARTPRTDRGRAPAPRHRRSRGRALPRGRPAGQRRRRARRRRRRTTPVSHFTAAHDAGITRESQHDALSVHDGVPQNCSKRLTSARARRASRRDDENGVVAGQRADHFRQVRRIDGHAEQLRLAWAGAQHHQLLHAIDAGQIVGGGAMQKRLPVLRRARRSGGAW